MTVAAPLFETAMVRIGLAFRCRGIVPRIARSSLAGRPSRATIVNNKRSTHGGKRSTHGGRRVMIEGGELARHRTPNAV